MSWGPWRGQLQTNYFVMCFLLLSLDYLHFSMEFVNY